MKTPQVCHPHPSLPCQTSEEEGELLEKHDRSSKVSMNGKQDHLILGREVLCPIVLVQSWMMCLRWSYTLLGLRAHRSLTFSKLDVRGTEIVVKRPKVSNFPMDPTLRSIIDNPDPGKRYRHLQDYSGAVKMTDDLLL